MTPLSARLAYRMLRGSPRAGLSRMAAFVICAAAAVLFGLIAASVPGIADAQLTRDRLRAVRNDTGRVAAEPDAGMKIFVSDIMVAETRRWRRVFVYDVRNPARAATPPGITHAPLPGEVFLSPAAARLIDSQPRYATWAPGRRAGVIGPAGLGHPDELYAYVGRASNAPQEPNLDVTFGVSPAEYRITPDRSGMTWETSWSQGTMQYLDAGAVVIRLVPATLVPVAALTLAALGMSSGVYRRRWARAYLAGMSRGLIGRIAAWEGAAAGLTGGVAGCLAAALAWPGLGTAGITQLSWYPQDAALPPSVLVAAVAVATITLAGVTALSAVRCLRPDGQIRRGAPKAQRLIPAAAVLAWSLAAVPLADYKGLFGRPDPGGLLARAYSPQVGYALMTIAIVVTIAAIEPITVALSSLVRPRHGLPTRLAARFAAGNPALAPRLVAVPMLLISLLGLHAGNLDAVNEVRQTAYGADGRQSVGIDQIDETLKQRFLASPVARYARVTRQRNGIESLDIVFPRARADDVMSDVQAIMPELRFERGMEQTLQQRAQLYAVLLPAIFLIGLAFSMPMVVLGAADALRGDNRFATALHLIGAPERLTRSAISRALTAMTLAGLVVASIAVAVTYNVVYLGTLYGTETEAAFGFPAAYVLGGAAAIGLVLWLCRRTCARCSRPEGLVLPGRRRG
ncbi:hypothetical protein AB0O28_05640 [Microbispora sp. NPDC088329]|uniref:hypothetical protein n=1 Tax=Microbispora sp. NPDC088329 TaxID=3154869 RepID=UPI00344735E1